MHCGAQRDLDVHLDVRRIHASRVVDRVGIAASAVQGIGNTALLGDTQIGTLTDHLGAYVCSINADGVVGPVADFGIRFRGGLDVSADTAEPEQVDRRLQDGRHDVHRCRGRCFKPDGSCGFRREFDGLLGARNDHCAGREGRLVVVLPAGARQVEHALALRKRDRRIRIGVDHDVAVVEGSDQPDLFRQQHAVAENVTRHVANAGHGERRCLDVYVDLAEVTLHRLPAAAGRDAHFLVVVTSRTTRSESIVQPEACCLGQTVCRVGEGSGALVGCHDEIGIVTIRTQRIGRRGNLATDDVVGDRQECPDVCLVGLRPGREPCLAVALGRQEFREESTLCADGNDDRVFDLLGLHQAQNFRAVILRAIRPAEATTGNLAEAQVHAFHFDAIDEDFAEWARLRQTFELVGIELEGEHRTLALLVALLEEVGAQRRFDRIDVATQNAVFVQALDVGQPAFKRLQ